MKTIDYDSQEKNTGNTPEHMATDQPMSKKFGNIQRAYEEGFAAADGIMSANTDPDGGIIHPAVGDASLPSRAPDTIEDENAGLADS
jgi:hypothetical protein